MPGIIPEHDVVGNPSKVQPGTGSRARPIRPEPGSCRRQAAFRFGCRSGKLASLPPAAEPSACRL